MSKIFTIAVPDDDVLSFEDVRQTLLKQLADMGVRAQVWKGFRSENADVRACYNKFGFPVPPSPMYLGRALLEARLKHLHEELDEFSKAHGEYDMHGAADALIDLAYVTHGTAVLMGLPWYSLWDEVQRKNMLKERATNASQSKRGTTIDIIKPVGWTPPDHSRALGTGPWPTGDDQ